MHRWSVLAQCIVMLGGPIFFVAHYPVALQRLERLILIPVVPRDSVTQTLALNIAAAAKGRVLPFTISRLRSLADLNLIVDSLPLEWPLVDLRHQCQLVRGERYVGLRITSRDTVVAYLGGPACGGITDTLHLMRAGAEIAILDSVASRWKP